MAQINSYRYRTKATGDKSRTQSVDYRWGAPVTGKLARGWDVRETVRSRAAACRRESDEAAHRTHAPACLHTFARAIAC
jgi:hypothetical protein